MTYTTLAALQNRFGAATLVQLTDRAPVPTGVVDVAVVNQELGNADAVINASLAVRYQLPLATVPVAVADLALAIAIYKLHPFDPAQKIKDDYAQALRDLKELSQGTKKLDVAGAEPATADTGGVVTSDRARDLTPDNLHGFI
ncbi:gp436 family protein [Sphingomonas sp.]|uniref:gp436 family protein n=1 Tax=Sphingomonas sp. TaxID=28214 RepID=UPI003CC59F35